MKGNNFIHYICISTRSTLIVEIHPLAASKYTVTKRNGTSNVFFIFLMSVGKRIEQKKRKNDHSDEVPNVVRVYISYSYNFRHGIIGWA